MSTGSDHEHFFPYDTSDPVTLHVSIILWALLTIGQSQIRSPLLHTPFSLWVFLPFQDFISQPCLFFTSMRWIIIPIPGVDNFLLLYPPKMSSFSDAQWALAGYTSKESSENNVCKIRRDDSTTAALRICSGFNGGSTLDDSVANVGPLRPFHSDSPV
jgi:hypothetical protein